MKLSLSGVGPTLEDYNLADRQRRLHLEHTPGRGVKTAPAWTRHRPTWALAYSRIRGEATLAEIEAAQDFAYTDTEPWHDGTEGWREVLERSRNPAETICRNLARLVNLATAKPRCRLERYSPGPGAQTLYYCDDQPISRAEYYKRGGK